MKENRMRRLFAVFLLLLSSSAYAWGDLGHKIVADIAQLRLKEINPDAEKEVRRLLHNQSMASVAMQPDTLKKTTMKFTKNWHFTDIPIDPEGTTYLASRDCVDSDCVVDQIANAKKTLGDTSKSDADRKLALIFLIHLVGDAHQPLHCAEGKLPNGEPDGGGNGVSVRVSGDRTNLHTFWDARLLERHGFNRADYVDFLENLDVDEDAAAAGTVEEWVNATHKSAEEISYKKLPANHRIDNAYFNVSLPLADQQLLKGGLRLARLINEALGE